MPGPLPDLNSVRQDRKNVQAMWTVLPASGRKGDPPAWPLGRASAAEARLWAREWSRPQAVEWERAGQVEEVALYVRTAIRTEDRDVGPTLIAQVRAMRQELGLSQVGLGRLRWKIEQEPTRQERTQTDDADRAAKKAKLRQIVGGAA